MQLEVKPYDLPQAVSFNYDELKAELLERTHVYETMVYTDDQIKSAKADRADLNRLKKALNDERLRLEKEYMAPFNEFKTKINEIISIIDKPASIIDQRVKEYEQQQKDEKKQQIIKVFEDAGLPDYITLEKVWDEKWLNATVSLSKIKDELERCKVQDEQNIEILSNLPEFSFEAVETYKHDLDMPNALSTASKLSAMAKAKKQAEEEAERQAQIAKAEAEKAKAEEIPFSDPEPEEVPEQAEPSRAWIKFEAYMSVDEATELRAFFNHYKIAFRAIRG